MTKRSCGSCSLCCKIMEVAPDIKPDNHNWCRHAVCAKTGVNALVTSKGGCGIYQHRPEVCRDYHCQWLIDDRHPDYWFPARSKIIINATINSEGKKYVSFIVDPAYPNRWREEPYFKDIKEIAQAGHDGRLGEKWSTLVVIKDERIPIVGTERLIRGTPSPPCR